jgi:hypothetical protein
MRVVPSLDLFEGRHAGRGLRLEPASVQLLAFERREEALGHGIAIDIADRANLRYHAHLATAFAENETMTTILKTAACYTMICWIEIILT